MKEKLILELSLSTKKFGINVLIGDASSWPVLKLCHMTTNHVPVTLLMAYTPIKKPHCASASSCASACRNWETNPNLLSVVLPI
jgi:hypothetical protein